MDLVVGHEGADRWQGADDFDALARKANLLLGLSQGGVEQLLVPVAPPAREGDLAGVAVQIRAALGEDEARVVRPAVHRDQHRRLGAAMGIELLGLLGIEEKPAQIR